MSNQVEDVMSILSGEPEPEQEVIEDLQEEETEAEEPEQEIEQEADEEEQNNETWSKLLNVEDDKIVIDDDGNFKGIKVKADGEEAVVEIPELIKSYQYHKHNVNAAQQVAEQKKQFEEVTNTVAQDYLTKIDTVSKLTEHLNKKLSSDFERIDWNRLRAENPAEYAATMQDMQSRQYEIQQIYQAIEQERQIESTRINKQAELARQEYLKQQIDYALEKNPHWSDKQAMTKELGEMADFALEKYNVPKELFNSVEHAALFEVLKDAMKYHQGKNAVAKKIEKPLPKFQKPSGKPVKQVSNLDKLITVAKTTQGYNRGKAQVDAVSEMLKGVI